MKGNVTPTVKEVLKVASQEARAYDYKRLEPEHVLLAILINNANNAVDILHELKVDIDKIFNEVSDHINNNNINPVIGTIRKEIPPTEPTKKILKYAVTVSKDMESDVVDVEHVLLSLLISQTKARDMLNKNKVNYPDFLNKIYQNKNAKNPNPMEEYNEADDSLNSEELKAKNKNSKTPVLDNFCADITNNAKLGKIDPVIGREKEIKRVSQILSRRKKNNPVLIGEAGVGKSTIVEGLALLISQGACPTSLADNQIYSLNIAAVVAGTKYRGQFEARMKGILEELIANPQIILFIDELHTIVGAGNSSGAQDMSNIFKPALARGEIQVIGATTLDEFRENIEKDGALTRRFQQVLVKEPNLEETEIVLNNIKDKYEDFHKVSYTEEAIKECVRMADRYITDRAMPDKAIDVMDECGATTNVDLTKPEHITELEDQKKEVIEEKKLVVKKQEYEKAAKLRESENKLTIKIEKAIKDWKNSINEDRTIITGDIVAEVVSLMTGIPLNKISSEENKRLAKMGDTLKTKVIGQDEAIIKVCKAIQRNKLGIGNIDKPIGSFIFLGNTGVGKTHLTKVIAEYLFGDSDSLIRIDMGEYMEKFNVTRLIGAPPGYVGYEEGGKLTEQVRRKPHSVVLFDEIEKAHPDVFNLMLNILDEGYITDSLGRKINFRNTLIIMTSNIGVKEVAQFGNRMGYASPNAKMDDQKRVEQILNKSVKDKFKPEFLNRLDDIVIFNQLKEEEILQMVEIEMNIVKKRIAEKGYLIDITKKALEYVAQEGYSKEYGARPLRRAIQNLIEDRIAEEIMSGNLNAGDTLKIGFNKSATPNLTFKV